MVVLPGASALPATRRQCLAACTSLQKVRQSDSEGRNGSEPLGSSALRAGLEIHRERKEEVVTPRKNLNQRKRTNRVPFNDERTRCSLLFVYCSLLCYLSFPFISSSGGSIAACTFRHSLLQLGSQMCAPQRSCAPHAGGVVIMRVCAACTWLSTISVSYGCEWRGGVNYIIIYYVIVHCYYDC